MRCEQERGNSDRVGLNILVGRDVDALPDQEQDMKNANRGGHR